MSTAYIRHSIKFSYKQEHFLVTVRLDPKPFKIDIKDIVSSFSGGFLVKPRLE